MDSQPPLAWDPQIMSMLRFASYLLPTDQYSTVMVNFPGTNCIPHFQSHGDFYHSFQFWVEGKKVADLHGPHCTDQGMVELHFDDVLKGVGEGLSGVVITEFYHSSKVPAEIYFAHFHKKTGQYLSYPGLPFQGDELYPEVHANQLENTLFWPGLTTNKNIGFSVMVLNPYNLAFSYQISLYRPNGERVQSEVLKLKRRRAKIHALEDLFPEYVEEVRANQGRSALCVAAQYKIVVYGLIRDVRSGVITAVDHFHNYCLI